MADAIIRIHNGDAEVCMHIRLYPNVRCIYALVITYPDVAAMYTNDHIPQCSSSGIHSRGIGMIPVICTSSHPIHRVLRL